MIIMSNDTLVTALEAGSHEITPNFTVESRTCGLIPVGKYVEITQYNFDLRGNYRK